MNILEVQNLCKIYGSGEAEVRALNQVSFSVRRGSLLPSLVNPALAKARC